MEINLNRIARKPDYTIGRLYVDGGYVCDTLEDTDRGLMQGMRREHIGAIKQKGKTAIPVGRYAVTLSQTSPRFQSRAAYQFCKGKLPRLLNVDGFSGILIHIGNTADDTEGCILVGKNTKVGMVLESTATFTKLYKILKTGEEKGGKIWITIR